MKRAPIERYIKSRYPDVKWAEVSRKFGVSVSNVAKIAKDIGYGNPVIARKRLDEQKRKQKLDALLSLPQSECISSRCVWYRHTGERCDPIRGTIQQGTCIWRECRLKRRERRSEHNETLR